MRPASAHEEVERQMPSVSKRVERAIAAFTARSPERDAKVDWDRIRLLTDSIDTVMQDIFREKAGLVARVRNTVEAPNPPGVFWNLARRPQLSITEFSVVEKRLQFLQEEVLELEDIKERVLELLKRKSPAERGDASS